MVDIIPQVQILESEKMMQEAVNSMPVRVKLVVL
jgi:hypothetical protein